MKLFRKRGDEQHIDPEYICHACDIKNKKGKFDLI